MFVLGFQFLDQKTCMFEKLEFYCQVQHNNCMIKMQRSCSVTLLYMAPLVHLYTQVLIQNPANKEQGSRVFFELRTSKTAELVRTGYCCLSVSAQFSEKTQFASIKGKTVFELKSSLSRFHSMDPYIQEKKNNYCS